MCGVAYSKSFKYKPVNSIIELVYEFQKTRGTDGYGFTEVFGDRISTKRFKDEKDALAELKKSQSSEILFHHRQPTSTENDVKSNHPIITTSEVYKYNYYFIHNGCITNDEYLKKEHEKLGIKYNTTVEDKFNDSESLMHELILVIEGIKKPEEFEAIGSMAFIMLQTDKNNKAVSLCYGRWNNPLTLFQLEDSLTIRSVGGSGNEISENILYKFDYITRKTTEQPIKFGERWVERFRKPEEVEKKSTEQNISVFAETICELYDYKYITHYSLTQLDKECLNTLLLFSKRARVEAQLNWESAILGDNANFLSTMFVRLNYERSVKNIETISKFIKGEDILNIYD